MAILTITSETITEADLSNISETVRVYSADIDGRKLPDKWIVPNNTDDVIARSEFSAHLTLQGYVF